MAVEPRDLSRRPVMRGTVRARTTLAVTLVVGLAFAGAGMALVAVLRDSLVHDIQQVAELHATDVAVAVRQGRVASPIPADDDEIVQVVDAGAVVAASANLAGLPALSAGRPVADEPVAWTVTDPLGVPGQFRLVGVRAGPSARVVVYAGTSLKLADETGVLVRSSLLVGAPLLIALVALMTWTAVGRSLRPVEEIRSEVAEISSRDLSRRVPVPREQDEIGRLAGTMNAMLERLEGAAERQRRFVADASHELKSPLAAVRTDLEVAIAHPDQTPWLSTAGDLLAQNQKMQRLVADLLFVARADGTSTLSDPRPVDLHEVVLAEVSQLSASHLHLDSSAVEPAFVAGRQDDLARATRNLLENAAQYARSSVAIGLSNRDGVVTLVVEDDGSGIAPEHRDRVFERFARLDQARSRATGGTGLGLAIVRDIVEQHHGRVAVQDGAVGARFVVTLPAD